MLSGIKEMIASKSAFLEAADMLFEEGMGTNLDNAIVLGEEAEATDGEIEEEAELEAEEQPVEDSGETEEDLLNSPIDDDQQSGTPAPTGDDGADDILSQPIDEPAPGAADPVEGPSPDPTTDPIDDILNTEIDLRSNTMNDTLPIPPAAASDAVAEANDEMDGFLNQRIDTGYGGESTSGDEPLEEKTHRKLKDDDKDDKDKKFKSVTFKGKKKEEDPEKEKKMTEAFNVILKNYHDYFKENTEADSVDWSVISEGVDLDGLSEGTLQQMLLEAISLDGGGDASGDTSSDTGSSDAAPDTGSDGGDNSVTAAVKDKVDEMQDDSSSFDDTDSGEEIGGGSGNIDKEIMDKVMKASASLEDVKKAFINSKQ